MQIKELFERDPTRNIEPIVKVTLHDPKIIRTELEEYVVTDQIKEFFLELTGKFIESRTGTQPNVCTWISGFFGSGKSHFLKLLGYVLENKGIELDDGNSVGAAEYFFNKHSLPKATALIIEKELKTKALFVNMLDFDREKGPDITRIIYQALLRQLNLSETFWISEIERRMQDKNVYSKFLSFVEEKEAKPWHEIRKNVLNARTILSQGLVKILPDDYYNLDVANQSINDVKEEFSINPGILADKLLEEATKIDENKGRYVILLDEVGLYVGTDNDRLTDLNAISESITKICGDKVWLYVTAQEALEEVIPKVDSIGSQFEWIKDRFDQISLSPENIDTVVKKRLLQKTSDQNNLSELKTLYDDYSGALTLNITIKDPAHDPQGLFTTLDDKNQFVTSYPFSPYYIRLIQEILGNLRSKGRGEGLKISGRERAVLNIIKSVLVSEFDDTILIENDLGKLATLNMVYDAINEELKAVRSAQQAVIEHDISGECDGLKVNSVAKVVFLLQQVNWIPSTLENIGAVLYSDIGIEQDQHLNTIKKCLQRLQEKKWIAVDDDEYRFLTEVERTFEHIVASQNVTEHEKRELSNEIFKDVMKSFKIYNYDRKPFNVHFSADNQEISSKGHLNLKFYSPYFVIKTDQIEDSKLSESIAYRDTVYWLSKPDKKFDEYLEKVISIQKALEEKNKSALSEEERKILEKPLREMENYKEDDLPRLFNNAAREGKIFFR